MPNAEKRSIRIALAGNANVGKSVIFNYLTGLHQHIGNWPGKTVEKAEGTLRFKGYTVDILDLPGIYSLSAFSLEERISREYIAIEKPDLVINVVDASALERNLFFTIQLIELETPMIVALNQMDVAERKGITIDELGLQKFLGVPVISTIATRGVGLSKLLDKAVEVVRGETKAQPVKVTYGKEIEEKIDEITKLIEGIPIGYPARWVAIKLLEGDEEVRKIVHGVDPKIVSNAEKHCKDLERIHGEPCPTITTSERYDIANRIARGCQRIRPSKGPTLTERLDALVTHPIMGYPFLIGIMLSILFVVFTVGGYLSGFFEEAMEPIIGAFGGGVGELIGEGLLGGLIAGIAIVLPYIVPFYLILTILEDSGYLPRAAFMTDSLMHKMGIHGKAFIPFILGYGCNVPACLGCRIMETERERTIAAFIVTLVPCAAVTIVVLGLVGAYVGIQWALSLYVLNLAMIFILGRVAFKVLPGEPMSLIMEMPLYRKPHARSVLKETWMRVKDFIYIAFPLIIVGSVVLTGLKVGGLLEPIGDVMSPVTVGWLELPAIAGVLLIFGVLRKELTLVMLATLIGTTNFGAVLTPTQMIVFAIVVMYYIPCIATIAALVRELGWKKAAYITVFEILFALLLGGIAFRILSLL